MSTWGLGRLDKCSNQVSLIKSTHDSPKFKSRPRVAEICFKTSINFMAILEILEFNSTKNSKANQKLIRLDIQIIKPSLPV